MANAQAGTTSHKTPPPNSNLSAEESGLQSNSHTVGSAVFSEHISTVGVQVNNVCPWIARDVQNFETCEADDMLKELLARCTGPSQSLSASEKKTLFETSLKAVLPICNKGAVAQEIKGHLIDFCEVDKETASYAPFVRVANCALLELREVKVHGIPTFKDDDKTNILLNVNDPMPIYQDHQGAQSERKPDVVVVSPDLVLKLYWPEETRQSEADILEEVYRIAETELDVQGHVPDLVWSHTSGETSTSKIRIALGLRDAEHAKRGSRVLYALVFRKLVKITTLSGKDFLGAWWQVVKCHRALWERGVHHRDVNPSNCMGYILHDQFISVLNDYDLASFQRDSPSGLERTGTLPFMAVDLLTPEAITGNVEHVYAHDAESFIWALAWVCLRYEGGNLLSKKRPLENWLKYDAISCRIEKVDFLTVRLKTLHPTGSHEESWEVVKKCFQGIHSLYTPTAYLKLADQPAFELLLENPMLEHL